MSDERKPLVPLYSDEYLEGEKYRHADTLSNGAPTYMDWDCIALIHVKSMIDEYEKDRRADKARIAELERQLAAQEASGAEWTPSAGFMYEYPDGKRAIVYTSSDGYGRAQMRYLQDLGDDDCKTTIIILPDHLRIWELPQPQEDRANG